MLHGLGWGFCISRLMVLFAVLEAVACRLEASMQMRGAGRQHDIPIEEDACGLEWSCISVITVARGGHGSPCLVFSQGGTTAEREGLAL